MPREYSCFDDFTWVTGLKKNDDVLFVGGNMTLPFLKKYVRSVNYVKKAGELNKLVASGRQFDRIFIARENVLSAELVIKAAQLSRKPEGSRDSEGLVCFFSEDETLRNAFGEIVENSYPLADVWSLQSNLGPVVVTNAKGNPGWMD